MKEALKGNQILGEIDFRDPLKHDTDANIEKAKRWAENLLKTKKSAANSGLTPKRVPKGTRLTRARYLPPDHQTILTPTCPESFQVIFAVPDCIMRRMQIRVIETGAFFENCYVLWDSKDKAFVVDPGADANRIIAELQKNELTPSAYLLTHGHLDHLSAITALVARHPAPVYLSREDADWAFTRLNGIPPYVPVEQAPKDMDTDLHEGRIITAGTLKARVIQTPGHTPGCVCYAFDDEKVLVSGDTLFRSSIGRTDLPGGSGKRILESLAKLMELDDGFKVLPGHGGATTIGEERRENPYIVQGR